METGLLGDGADGLFGMDVGMVAAAAPSEKGICQAVSGVYPPGIDGLAEGDIAGCTGNGRSKQPLQMWITADHPI